MDYNYCDFKRFIVDGRAIIPKGVTIINDYAFEECSDLISISIPDSVTKIGNSAFYECFNLREIEIPNSLTEIGEGAFDGCWSLTCIEIPNSVSKIGAGAFRNCKSLANIEIPNSITEINDLTFWGCSNLKSIAIPKSVRWIGSRVFNYCSNLSSIVVQDSNPFYTSIDNCLLNKTLDYLLAGCNESIIPFTVDSIAPYAFCGSGLTNINIPDSINKIVEGMFMNCTNLTHIVIPQSITVIEDYAFMGCTHLASVMLPNSEISIAKAVFSECTSLTSLEIPSTCRLYCDALYGCFELNTIVLREDDPDNVRSIGAAIPYEQWSNITLIVPIGTGYAYRHHPYFSQFKEILPIL